MTADSEYQVPENQRYEDQAYEYQVGGSLRSNAPSYVERQSDGELYQALIQGELCYVFNSRQMGKSSLRLRTKQRLQQAGMRCASIDLARIGSKLITPEQWYMGIVVDLVRGFDLFDRFDLTSWWRDRQGISLIQRLSQFIQEVLLTEIPDQRLFIFLDEIDSVLSLDFSVDDFFALIRSCYNQRAEDPAYDRLGWALFGVATPADLIRDPALTPFNIGRAIDLQGFKLAEVQPLIGGLVGKVSNPQAVLKKILAWTGGQPFLTQKLCRIVSERGRSYEQLQDDDANYQLDQQLPIAHPHLIQVYYSLPVLAIEKFVRSQLIEQWEAQDQPEHLKTIRDRLLNGQQGTLELYQNVLHGAEVPLDHSPAQLALLLSGVVVRQQGRLQVANRIYREVFNLAWVNQQLATRRPRSQPVQPDALSRQNAILQAQQEAAIDGILLVDEHQQVVSCNRRFQELWQIPDRLLQSGSDQSLLEFVLAQLTDPQAFLAKINALYQHPTETSRDEILFQDGRVFDRYSSPVRSDSGDYYGRIWFFRDITAQKQAAVVQAKLLEQEKQRRQELETAKQQAECANRAKSAFIAHLSHELRTPLHAILGFTQQMERDRSLTATQRENLQIIYQNGEHLLSSINHLLELSKNESESIRLQERTLQPVPAPEALTAEMLANLSLANISQDWLHQFYQAALRTDEDRLHQLLTQLPVSDAAIAAVLREWIQNFRCDKILDLIQPLLQ